VLLAIHDGGVMACQNGKIIHQYKTSNCDFIPHDLVYWIHEDHKGNWWLGTYKGVGVRYKDGREYCFSRMPGIDALLSKEITCIMEDNDGSLWLATNNNGIVHVTGNMEQPETLHCQNYCMENKLLPVNTPLCFLLDKSGRIWVGTEGSGLCLYNVQDDCFESVHQAYNLPGDMVGSMEEDNHGNLWLGTNQGLARLTITGEEKGRVRTFTVADGLADNFFNQNASFYRNGTFYFGCSRGIVTFDSEMMKEKHSDISLRITDILIDGKSLEQQKSKISSFTADYTKTLIIPSAYTNFTIRFASLTYNQPQLNKYAYRLQGFDTDWHYVNAANRNAYYSQLPAGEYVFELRATNENGDWGEMRTMEILIEPPFWATWWAYLIYALLTASFLGLIWWEIRRRLMLRNRKYLQKGETDKVHHIKLQFFSNITSDDEKFLQDAIDCVNRHLDDPEFDVTQFVNEMATSRTTLHKKMKSLTGLNTTSFVRSIRLKAACKIMDENKNIRISDLAYKVGFNDPKYFSICFKKEFGMQPTEYSMKSAKNT
jgi:two-component system sensor histidine kinase/response regulator, hybrid (one-component system)